VTDLGTVTTADINGGTIDNVTIGATTPSAATVSTLNGHDEVRVLQLLFFDQNCTDSQSAAEWCVDNVDPSAGQFKQIPMASAGSVVGIAVYGNAACTSGTLTADATVNGSATGLQAGLNSVDDTQTSYTTQANDADTFTAGQRIGVKVTTSNSPAWAPITDDVVVVVTVEY